MEENSKYPFKDIHISIIPVGCQRQGWNYGDYFVNERGGLEIRVSEFINPVDALALIHHELNEAWNCASTGISYEDIDKFDLAHHETEDPGLLKCAPYHSQHMDAEQIERLICHQNGRDWEDHYNSVPTGYVNKID